MDPSRAGLRRWMLCDGPTKKIFSQQTNRSSRLGLIRPGPTLLVSVKDTRSALSKKEPSLRGKALSNLTPLLSGAVDTRKGETGRKRESKSLDL